MLSQTTLRLFTLGLTFASSLLVACSPGDAPPAVKQRQSTVMPWAPYNSAQAFGGKIDTAVIRGIHRDANTTGSPEGWWLRSSSSDHYAPILDMTYGGSHVLNLTTEQGWLLIETEGGGGRFDGQSKGQELYISLGAPLNTALRVRHASDGSSFGQYTAEYLGNTGTGWTSFCPHPVETEDGTHFTIDEHMVPVGGAAWELNGIKTPAAADTIQLSCTHDSIGACATWGYLPWDRSLANHHQACTRMKRGDFCGTGDPATTVYETTFAHTQVQVWDSLGIHEGIGQTQQTIEAYWNIGGAVCFNRDNYRADDPTAIARMQITVGSQCPQLPSCDKDSSGLIVTARPCDSSLSEEASCSGN